MRCVWNNSHKISGEIRNKAKQEIRQDTSGTFLSWAISHKGNKINKQIKLWDFLQLLRQSYLFNHTSINSEKILIYFYNFNKINKIVHTHLLSFCYSLKFDIEITQCNERRRDVIVSQNKP